MSEFDYTVRFASSEKGPTAGPAGMCEQCTKGYVDKCTREINCYKRTSIPRGYTGSCCYECYGTLPTGTSGALHDTENPDSKSCKCSDGPMRMIGDHDWDSARVVVPIGYNCPVPKDAVHLTHQLNAGHFEENCFKEDCETCTKEHPCYERTSIPTGYTGGCCYECASDVSNCDCSDGPLRMIGDDNWETDRVAVPAGYNCPIPENAVQLEPFTGTT
jgi:hypothetical protein